MWRLRQNNCHQTAIIRHPHARHQLAVGWAWRRHRGGRAAREAAEGESHHPRGLEINPPLLPVRKKLQGPSDLVIEEAHESTAFLGGVKVHPDEIGTHSLCRHVDHRNLGYRQLVARLARGLSGGIPAHLKDEDVLCIPLFDQCHSHSLLRPCHYVCQRDDVVPKAGHAGLPLRPVELLATEDAGPYTHMPVAHHRHARQQPRPDPVQHVVCELHVCLWEEGVLGSHKQ
mmetsp:Transcript_25792/g.72215  ORF Transcript_25792/g.72215 Transcript_25792/m.72215 type:complete len:229 (-) Transcript_25792:669-1355(-)